MKKTFKRILSLVATTAVVLSVGLIPVNAAENTVGTTTTFNKYLTMKEEANVPEVTFNYTIEKTNPKGGTGDVLVNETRDTSTGLIKTPRVYSTKDLVGTPKITESVTFRPGDVTYAEVQAGDTVVLKAGYKYAKKTLTLDFSGVTFEKPGVYRFKISEAATVNDGITNDSTADRYCDVYINQKDGSIAQDLEVKGYAIHKSSDGAVQNVSGDWGAIKDNGFVNDYETFNLRIQKSITGNQGWKNNYFEFTLVIDGVLPNSRYNLDLSNATNPKNSEGLAFNSVGGDKVYYLQADAEGKVTYTFYLSNKNGNQEYIIVNGLTAATTYNISEDCQDYDASWTITQTPSNTVTATGTASDALDNAYSMGKTDNTVLFVNNREGTVPTGVFFDVAPYAILTALAVGGVAVLAALKKKKKVSE